MTIEQVLREGVYYTDTEVAGLLGISLGRLRNKLCAGNPLPPRIQPPGCRNRLWPCKAVHEWLEQFTVTVVDPLSYNPTPILVARRKIVSEPRYRGNGSRSSNCYKLLLDGGDKLSPPPDTGVTPRTTSRTQKEPLPQKIQTKPIAPVEMVSAKGGGGDFFELEYPKGLSASEREEARKKLAALSVELAQQLLDELAGRMAADTIRVSPLAYLRGLIDRAHQGDFTPEVARKVAEKRKCRRQTEAARERSESAHKKAVADRIATVTGDSNPLVRKLADIRRKAQGSGGKAE